MNNQAHMSLTITFIVILMVTLTACTSVPVLFGPQKDGAGSPIFDVDRQLQEVKVGSPRDEAVKVMDRAWHHGKCEWQSGTVSDVFLYGPKNVQEVQVAVITSKPLTGTLIVVSATRAENDSLRQYGFGDCVPAWLLK
ncbi:hypothetical protein ANAEL_03535 [Anaerolineales bacterium]|nr:hypothetical protein ANAEL_03535 [Anaerolineales bacterium]